MGELQDIGIEYTARLTSDNYMDLMFLKELYSINIDALIRRGINKEVSILYGIGAEI